MLMRVSMWTSVLLATTIAGTTIPASAMTDPGTDCAVKKQKAVAKALKSTMKCYETAASDETAVDGLCLSDAEAKMAGSFQAADDKGGCLVTANAPSVALLLGGGVDDLIAAFPLAGGDCAATHRKIASRFFTDLLKCSMSALSKDTEGVAEDCLAKAKDRVGKSLTSLDASNDCASDPFLEPTIEVLAIAESRILADTPASACPSSCTDRIDALTTGHQAGYVSNSALCADTRSSPIANDDALPTYTFTLTYLPDLCGPGGCYPNWESVSAASVASPQCVVHNHSNIDFAPISYRQWGACARAAMAAYMTVAGVTDPCTPNP